MPQTCPACNEDTHANRMKEFKGAMVCPGCHEELVESMTPEKTPREKQEEYEEYREDIRMQERAYRYG